MNQEVEQKIELKFARLTTTKEVGISVQIDAVHVRGNVGKGLMYEALSLRHRLSEKPRSDSRAPDWQLRTR